MPFAKESLPKPQAWVLDLCLEHLPRFIPLRLEGQPAFEIMGETALIWAEGLCSVCQWNYDRDHPRLERAFCALIAHSKRWPSPQNLLDELPPIRSTYYVPELRKPSNEKVAAYHIHKLKEFFRLSDANSE